MGRKPKAPLRGAFTSDKNRALYDTAIRSGWRCQMMGSGHVRCINPATGEGFVLSVTLKGGVNRAYLNNRSAARRAGLDVWSLPE